MRDDIRKMVLDWGRCHQLLDLLGVPDAPTLTERVRKILSRRRHPKPISKQQHFPTDEQTPKTKPRKKRKSSR